MVSINVTNKLLKVSIFKNVLREQNETSNLKQLVHCFKQFETIIPYCFKHEKLTSNIVVKCYKITAFLPIPKIHFLIEQCLCDNRDKMAKILRQ